MWPAAHGATADQLAQQGGLLLDSGASRAALLTPIVYARAQLDHDRLALDGLEEVRGLLAHARGNLRHPGRCTLMERSASVCWVVFG